MAVERRGERWTGMEVVREGTEGVGRENENLEHHISISNSSSSSITLYCPEYQTVFHWYE